jgi:alkanesulfonate monooxygenase SsuD/methylene tetrahydromethanopterin reductase-like flavin-dependent oxidoreductase (luciferase family)
LPAEALDADQPAMHAAWIGEHHFNSLGVLSCPDLVHSYIAARTRHIRLAPAVTCCRCTIRSASPSSGRRSTC